MLTTFTEKASECEIKRPGKNEAGGPEKQVILFVWPKYDNFTRSKGVQRGFQGELGSVCVLRLDLVSVCVCVCAQMCVCDIMRLCMVSIQWRGK